MQGEPIAFGAPPAILTPLPPSTRSTIRGGIRGWGRGGLANGGGSVASRGRAAANGSRTPAIQGATAATRGGAPVYRGAHAGRKPNNGARGGRGRRRVKVVSGGREGRDEDHQGLDVTSTQDAPPPIAVAKPVSLAPPASSTPHRPKSGKKGKLSPTGPKSVKKAKPTPDTTFPSRQAYSSNAAFRSIRDNHGYQPYPSPHNERNYHLNEFPVGQFSRFNPPICQHPEGYQVHAPLWPSVFPSSPHAQRPHSSQSSQPFNFQPPIGPSETPQLAGPHSRRSRAAAYTDSADADEAIVEYIPTPSQPQHTPQYHVSESVSRYSPSRPAQTLLSDPVAHLQIGLDGQTDTVEDEGPIDEKGLDMEVDEGKDELDSGEEDEGNGEEASNHNRSNGIEWYRMPVNCSRPGEPDKAKRDLNRQNLVAGKVEALKQLSRKVTRTLWRDDGCALEWVLQRASNPAPTQPGPSAEPELPVEVENAPECLPAPATSHLSVQSPTRAVLQISTPSNFRTESSSPIAPAPTRAQSRMVPEGAEVIEIDDSSDDSSSSSAESDNNRTILIERRTPSSSTNSGRDNGRATRNLARPSLPIPRPDRLVSESQGTIAGPSRVIRVNNTVETELQLQAADTVRYLQKTSADDGALITFTFRGAVQLYDGKTLQRKPHASTPQHMASGHLVQDGTMLDNRTVIMTTSRPAYNQNQIICARIGKKTIMYSHLFDRHKERRLDSICRASADSFLTGGPIERGEHGVYVWNLRPKFSSEPENGKPIKLHHLHGNTITSLAYSGVEKTAFSGSLDNSVVMWDLNRNAETRTIRLIKPVHQLHINNANPKLIAIELGSTQGQYQIYDTRAQRMIRSFGFDSLADTNAKPKAPSRFCKGSFHQIFFASGHPENGTVRIWDLRHTATSLAEITTPPPQVLLSFWSGKSSKDDTSRNVRQVLMTEGELYTMTKTRLLKRDWTKLV